MFTCFTINNLLFDIQVKLNLSKLKDISNDIDFCFKLAQEESVIILPGKNASSKRSMVDTTNFILIVCIDYL